ncbi:ECF transporter S component [Protaetiibacter intestinalis]|uniref:ECF transporter S component n=1 Tax=Protaetiibacter intestinalis TaxID=2419774 RepID=UPI0013006D78|nr:ECF transporter S component [Protaetiibacter intestinalis]
MGRFTTRYLLSCAAIGVAGGLLLIPANLYAATVAKGVPLLYAPVVGVWILPVVVALALLRRPGAGVLSALVAGLVTIPASPNGAAAVITMLMIGVLLELPFAVLLYRRWHPAIFLSAAVVLAVLYGFVTWRSLDVASLAPWAQATFIALLLVSAVVGTLLGRAIARAVERTGVTRGISYTGPKPTADAAPAAQSEAVAGQ